MPLSKQSKEIIEEQKRKQLNAESAPLPQNISEPSSGNGNSDLFTQALIGILPTIGGAIFGGSEGAAAGAQVGLQGLKQFQDQRVQEAKLDLENRRLKLDEMQFKEQRAARLSDLGNKFAEIQFRSDLDLQRQRELNAANRDLEELKIRAQERDRGVQITNQIAGDALKPIFDVGRKIQANVISSKQMVEKYRGVDASQPIEPVDGLNAVYNYLKTVDPDSAVLLSELENVSDLTGLFSKFEEKKAGESEEIYNKRISALQGTKEFIKSKIGNITSRSRLTVGNLRQLADGIEKQAEAKVAGIQEPIRSLKARAESAGVDPFQATAGLSALLPENKKPKEVQPVQVDKIDISKLSIEEKKKLLNQIRNKKGSK